MPRSTLVAMVRNHAVAIGIESMARAVFGPLLVEVGATRLALDVETDCVVEHRVILRCP
jgi:hypothetical protein